MFNENLQLLLYLFLQVYLFIKFPGTVLQVPFLPLSYERTQKYAWCTVTSQHILGDTHPPHYSILYCIHGHK